MKKLYVYADFDWLKEMELIGELGYESLRGADSYSFTFNNEWSRGFCNKATEYHDRIIRLVQKNARQIRKRMTA